MVSKTPEEQLFRLIAKGPYGETIIISKGALRQLKEVLSPEADIVTREWTGEERYLGSLKRWSVAAEKNAAMVIFPACEKDVSHAVQWVAAHGLELAVKSGGHATSGSSSTEDGACIDLSKMRGVIVDKERKVITCQGGALWSDINQAGNDTGLACVSGTVEHTGVAGLTLGGGYGYLQGEHGLVIDNLLAVKMILADGTAMEASESLNPDLFWAIRGAGAAFGIATSFSFQAHTQENLVWGGPLWYSIDKLPQVLDAMNHLMTLPDEKNAMFLGFTTSPYYDLMGDELILLVHLYYNGHPTVAENFYKPLLQLDCIRKATSRKSYAEMMRLPGTEHGLRRSMKGSAFVFPLTLEFATSVFHEFTDFLRGVPDARQSLVLFEFFRYEKMAAVPQTSTAFANRGKYSNFLCIMGWAQEENDKSCREWARKMSTMTKKEFEQKRGQIEGLDEVTQAGVGEYFNYDGTGIGGETAFGINFPRLAELKKKYDPTNMFSKGPRLHPKTLREELELEEGEVLLFKKPTLSSSMDS